MSQSALAVHGAVCHVEFSVPDLEAGRAFYSELFGWEFQDYTETELYFQTPSGSPCGCMLKGPAAGCSATRIFFHVDSIPAALTKAEGLGGKREKEATEIPGGHGFYGHVADPFGNSLGLYSGSGD